jgi:hypothetical protein
MLTALALVGRRFTSASAPLTPATAVRVAVAGLASGVVAVLVVRYCQLIGAPLRLGADPPDGGDAPAAGSFDDACREGLAQALLAGGAAFLGCLLLLGLGNLLPAHRWLGLGGMLAALGSSGWAIAQETDGNPLRWTVGLALAGVVSSALGRWLGLG